MRCFVVWKLGRVWTCSGLHVSNRHAVGPQLMVDGQSQRSKSTVKVYGSRYLKDKGHVDRQRPPQLLPQLLDCIQKGKDWSLRRKHRWRG